LLHAVFVDELGDLHVVAAILRDLRELAFFHQRSLASLPPSFSTRTLPWRWESSESRWFNVFCSSTSMSSVGTWLKSNAV